MSRSIQLHRVTRAGVDKRLAKGKAEERYNCHQGQVQLLMNWRIIRSQPCRITFNSHKVLAFARSLHLLGQAQIDFP
jgi:hypothetical protein